MSLLSDTFSDLGKICRISKTIVGRIVKYPFKTFSIKDRYYNYGPFSLIFPFYAHPEGLKNLYPGYDTFLGFITPSLPTESTAIDVGANCGDSLGEMFAGNQACTYLTIEAEPAFVRYLKKNQERLQAAFPNAKIFVEQALVGKELKQAELVAYAPSTRTTKPSDKGIKSRTLDSIVQDLALPPVSLLKVDVDGYDYDVINSAWGIVEKDRPAIFFEYGFFDFSAQQETAYEDLLARLFALGYKDWAVLDDTSCFVIRLYDLTSLVQLMNYPIRSKKLRLSYFNVFAVPEDKKAWMDNALRLAKVL